jgi:CheY-specific phosphatase CheX
MHPHDAVLSPMIHAAARDLFGHYVGRMMNVEDIESIQTPAATALLSQPGRTGVIGLTGASLRGTLILFISDRLLKATWSSSGEPPADWIGELANQALGSMKRLLLPHGIDFDLGLPSATSGTNCRIFIRPQSPLYGIHTAKGDAVLCFQYTSQVDLCLSTVANPDDDNPSED